MNDAHKQDQTSFKNFLEVILRPVTLRNRIITYVNTSQKFKKNEFSKIDSS